MVPMHPGIGSAQAREKETARVEAFSDGVFAIAITLLILEVRVPKPADLPPGVSLWAAVGLAFVHVPASVVLVMSLAIFFSFTGAMRR